MIFSKTKLSGVILLDIEKLEDERGFFARTWCKKQFAENFLETEFVQSSLSFNRKKGTIRGIHYQIAPHEEVKLVSCNKGSIFDVVVDLRLDSPTYRKWFATILTSKNKRTLYIPKGCAHGFQTLEDNTEVLYQISEFHFPEYARGILWNDPLIKIEWPLDKTLISCKDQSFKLIT